MDLDFKDIKIIKKKIKNIIIKVEDGKIIVSAPHRTSKISIERIIERNKYTIEKLIEEDKYRNRYKNKLFGKEVDTSLEDLEKSYRENLQILLDKLFLKYEKMTGLKAKIVKIRKMKSRWGTCYPEKKQININLKLAQRPIEEIEAVVLHELIHLKYINHDKRFIEECKKYMPEYLELEKRLKT